MKMLNIAKARSYDVNSIMSETTAFWTFLLCILLSVALGGVRANAQDVERQAGETLQLDLAGVPTPFHWAPAGKFIMGSPETEADRYSDEVQHEVTFTRGFWIAETETTQELWTAITGENPSRHTGSNQLPVEQVSWDDCCAFIETLNREYAKDLPNGYKFALPTEAQWEYACRAGTTTPYNFGESLNGDKANCDGESPYGTDVKGKRLDHSAPVRSYPPNAWGLYDMHGNVWEWTADRFGYDYYQSDDAKIDPLGSTSGGNRIFRGGSWLYDARSCRSAYRERNLPTYRGYNHGFRLAIVDSSQETR